MAYMNGTFQYFDNTFLWDRQDYKKPTIHEYPPGTLFGYLQEHHPKWLLVLKAAHRENLFTFTPNSSFTMFIPIEDSIPDQLITSMDRNTAWTIINGHTLQGAYTKDVLGTSRYQNLSTLTDGNTIYYTCTTDGIGILNRRESVLKYNIQYGNIILHLISGLLLS